jgi:DNA-binding response OmpR family regulator
LARDPTSAYDRIDFSRLSVVVGQLGGDGADEIQRQLGILGIRNPTITNDTEKTKKAIANDNPDLLICNMTVTRDDALSIVRDVRYQEIGANPFIVTLSMSPTLPQVEIVRTIDSGTDDLFIAPFSRDHFVMRVNDLAVNRRKFVAISSYIGPTRRTSSRPGRTTAEEFDVPNPVRATGTGMTRIQLRKEIAVAAKALSVRKLNADILLIRSLVGEVMPDYETSNISDDFRRRIGLLQGAVDTIRRRAERLKFDNLVTLCELSGNIVTEIRANPKPPNLRHLKAMPEMVNGFEIALLKMTEGGPLQ